MVEPADEIAARVHEIVISIDTPAPEASARERDSRLCAEGQPVSGT